MPACSSGARDRSPVARRKWQPPIPASAAPDVRGRKNGQPQEHPPGEPVTYAYVHDYEVTHSFLESLVQMVGYDMGHGAHLIQPPWMRCGTDELVQARN